MLPPVLPCLPWFVCLFAAVIFIVFYREVGHFLKFLFTHFLFVFKDVREYFVFLLRGLCKLFGKALVCAWDCAALAMCLQNVLALIKLHVSKPKCSSILLQCSFGILTETFMVGGFNMNGDFHFGACG